MWRRQRREGRSKTEGKGLCLQKSKETQKNTIEKTREQSKWIAEMLNLKFSGINDAFTNVWNNDWLLSGLFSLMSISISFNTTPTSHFKLISYPWLSTLSTTRAAFYAPYHGNSWRQQQFSGGHNREVSNIDQHIAQRNQRDRNEDGQWQVPESDGQKMYLRGNHVLNFANFNRIYVLPTYMLALTLYTDHHITAILKKRIFD